MCHNGAIAKERGSPMKQGFVLFCSDGLETGSPTGGADVSNRLETVDSLIRHLNMAAQNERTDSGRTRRESHRSINQAYRLSPVRDEARDTSPVLRRLESEKQVVVVNFDPPRPLKAEVCAAPSTSPSGLPIVYAEIHPLPRARSPPPLREKQSEDSLNRTYQSLSLIHI